MIAAGFPVRHLDRVFEAKTNGFVCPGIAVALKGATPPFAKHDGLFVDLKRVTAYHLRRAADWGLFNKLVSDGTLYHLTRAAKDVNVTAETSICVFFSQAEAKALRPEHPRSRVVAKPGLLPTKKLARMLSRKRIDAAETEDLLLATFCDQAMHFDGLWNGASGILFKSARGNWKRSRSSR